MMTLEQFLTQFKEFANTEADLVQAMLNAADLEIDRTVWGAKADQGQGYLAAHKLSLSPFGQGTRLAAKDGGTTYWAEYKRLTREVSSGFRVA